MRDLSKMLIMPLIGSLLFGQAAVAGSNEHVIKIATLAPEGSAWMQVFNDINKTVMAQTENRVKFRIYSGGVLGDENDMLRKMYIGQIQGAVLTTSTLDAIFKEMEVFQVPFLFQDYAEVDHILEIMTPFFRQGLAENGYALLGWSEGGFIRLMSTKPIATLDDLKKSKVWTWEEAPMTRAIFKEAGVSGIPLSVPDVLVGLQTGMVDVVYAPPAGAISLQWFTRIKYITDVPLMYLTGGIVVKKEAVDALPPQFQGELQKAFQLQAEKLKTVVRKENRDALAVMQKQGIELVKPSADQIEEFKQVSLRAIQQPGSREFSNDVLGKIERALNDFRERKSK
jgi:TRAP-type C4-dicarboxylate transport system substrate-binding protein